MMLKSNAVPETGDEVNDDDDNEDDKKHYKQQSNKEKTGKRKVSMCVLYNTYNVKKSVSYNKFSTGIHTNKYTFLRSNPTPMMTKTNNKQKQTKKKNKTSKVKAPSRRSQRIKENDLKKEIHKELLTLNHDKRKQLKTMVTHDEFIDWEKYAKIAGLCVPKEEDYGDKEPESSQDSSIWQDPTNPRYKIDMTDQELVTKEEMFYDTINIVIKPAIKYIEELIYNRQNKVIDKKGQEKLFQILTGCNLKDEE